MQYTSKFGIYLNAKGDKVPAALYKQGLAFLRIGEKPAGISTLELLLSKYPKTRAAKKAKTAIKKAKSP